MEVVEFRVEGGRTRLLRRKVKNVALVLNPGTTELIRSATVKTLSRSRR